MAFFVYKHTFPNGKVYIGITGTNPVLRWGNGCNYHQKRLKAAIKKYGWVNIKHEVLFEGLTKEQAEQKEIELIAEYKSTQREYGYNLTAGGNCRISQSEEAKRKIALGNKGKTVSEETKRKISAANKGRKLNEEQRKRVSLAHIGIGHTEETKRKIGLAQKGTKHHGCRKVAMIDQYTNEVIRVFDYIRQAQDETGIDEKGISIVCRGKGKTFHGYKWRYYEEVKDNVLCN